LLMNYMAEIWVERAKNRKLRLKHFLEEIENFGVHFWTVIESVKTH
jgi:hypothetical protein